MLQNRKDVKNMPKLRRRPPLYEEQSELLEYFFAYIDNCIDEQRLPTKEGMTVHCFNGRSRRYNYEQKDNFKDAFEIIYDVLADETINNKTVDAQIRKLVLQNKYKYSEKITTENINLNEDASKLTPEERNERIKELLSKLNNNTK